MDIAICRLCLTKNANLIDMFSDYDTPYRIPIVIVTHFAIEVQEEDKISKYICAGCWSKLEEFHQYYDYINSQQLSVGEGYAEFIDMKPDLKIITSEIKIEELVKTETESLDKFSTRNSDSDVEDFDSFVDPPIRSDSNVVQESLKKEVTNRITRSKTCKDLTSTSIRKSKKVKTKTRKSKIDTTNDEKKISEAKPKKLIINRIEEHALISNYFNLKCDFCSVTFDTNALVEARNHYQEVHDRKGYIKCCNKKFFKRVFVLEHIENHRNPEKRVYYFCDKCNRKCRTKESLRNHIAFHHPAIEDLIYKCNLCPKSFAKITFLKRHTIIHATEEEKIYKCNVCSKVFASIYLLQSHEKSHQNQEVMCEICAKIFRNKYNLKSHMREHTDNVPKSQCDECGKWYATERLVKTHKKRVHFITKGSFECDICKKITSSKIALRRHKDFSHGEKKLKCTLCDKMFRKPLALKEHLAVHRGQDLYTCQYCGQTFKSSANMYAHRKKVHFKEWLMEQRKNDTPN